MTAPCTSGYSLLEAAIVVAILLGLAAIAVPTFAGSSESIEDLRVRQDLEHLASQAESRLIRERGYSYAIWGTSAGAVAALTEEEPGLAGRLVALTEGKRNLESPGPIGVALTEAGQLVLAGISAGKNAECVMVVLQPRQPSDVMFAPPSEAGPLCPDVHLVDWPLN